MKIKVSILKDNQLTNQGTFASHEEANTWLSIHEEKGAFGPKAYSYEQQVEKTPAVIAADGTELVPAEYETITVEVPGYTIQIENGSQELINAEALAYLVATDWYVTRFAETGVAIPEEISAKRQEARQAIVK